MEPSTFAQQNAERAMESVNVGLSWAREFAEQALNQSKVAMDGLLKASNKMAKDFESQSSAIREHATTLTEKALSNSVDFGRKCLRTKEPNELVQLQTEFYVATSSDLCRADQRARAKNSERNTGCVQHIGGRRSED